MIGWLVFAATQVVAVAVMRPAYGLMRAHMIDSNHKNYPHIDPVKSFDTTDRGITAFGAIALSVIWPVALLGFGAYACVRRWLFGTKIASRWEKDHALTQATLRIQELERELGIR